MDKTYHVNTYNRFNVEFVKGNGVYLFDQMGNKYLDLLCGIAVTGMGHNNSALNKAVNDQINKMWHVSNLFLSTPQEKLAHRLCQLTKLDKVFYCNSGTEANEAAIKFARKYGNGKSGIITANGGFHGRTMGSLSATAQEKLWEGFYPMIPGFKFVPYNDSRSIKEAIDDETVAVMIEPVQGENGIIVPSDSYLNEIRSICDENNILMIVDEIQTGFGRTGEYFAFQHNDILPDIITLAKGIANGLPLGAVLVNQKVAEKISPGCHGSTFGGNPVAIAAANELVKLITPGLLDHIKSMATFLRKEIEKQKIDGIKEIRNKGLMVGLKIDEHIDVKLLAKDFLDNGVIVGTAGNNVLRLLPPLIIEEKHIEKFVYILKNLFKNMNISTIAS